MVVYFFVFIFFDLSPHSGLSDTIILDIISNYLVLPNRVTVPLVSEVQIAQLRFPVPKVSIWNPFPVDRNPFPRPGAVTSCISPPVAWPWDPAAVTVVCPASLLWRLAQGHLAKRFL